MKFTNYIKAITFFSLLLFSVFVFAQNDKKLVDKILSIVGDEIILLSDVELQYEQIKMENENVSEGMKCNLLEELMTQKMFLEQANIDSLVVSEDEVEGELNRRIQYFISMIGSQERLEEYYGKSITAIKDEFRKDIRDQLLSRQMRSKIFEDVKITPSEVKAFFNKIHKDSLPYFNAEVEIGQIVFEPEISPTQRQLAIEKIEGLQERIEKGEDFGLLALIYSEDPGSTQNNGELGFVSRGEMVKEFEAAAFKLEPGEVSEIVESQYGYHLIKMTDMKGQRARLSHILVKPKITSFDLKETRQRADSVKLLLDQEKIGFQEAVRLYSEDESTKHSGGMLVNPNNGTNSFEISQLDKSVYFGIDKLKPGEFSNPVLFQDERSQEQAYRILYLKSQSEPHEANLNDDYDRIKKAALQQKEDKVLQDWLNKKIRETYVKVDNFYDCENIKKWQKTNIITNSYE